MNMKKKWLNLTKNKRNLVVIGLILTAVLVAVIRRDSKSLAVSKLEKDVVTEVVSSSGPVESSGITEIYPSSTGLISKILVKNGQEVKQGQALLEITSTASEEEKATALAELNAAKVLLNKAENDKKTLQATLESARKGILDAVNTKKILDDNLTAQKSNPATEKPYTEEEKQAVESALTNARTVFANTEKLYLDSDENIKSARANYAEAILAYNNTRNSVTKSTATGVISNLSELVGSSVDSKTAVMVIKSSPVLKVVLDVSEYNIGKIKLDQPVEITLDAAPDEKIEGYVLGVDEVGNEALGTVTYGVTVVLKPSTEQEKIIRPAMSANVVIITNKKENVMSLPRSAIKVEKANNYVVVIKGNGEKEKRLVKTGLIGSVKVEIIDGLTESEKVLTVFEYDNEK